MFIPGPRTERDYVAGALQGMSTRNISSFHERLAFTVGACRMLLYVISVSRIPVDS